MRDGPLAGIRILDLTHVWAGPLATRTLADFGADVVKVEAPMSRGPREFPDEPLAGWISGEPGPEPWNNNAIFAKLARNKRSLALDLKMEPGRALFLDLARVADVLVENFSADAMDRLGLGYEVLAKINPQLIYVAMPGYGRTGPYSGRVAFGPTVESMSGFTSVMGYGAGEPRNTGMALMDPVAGVHAVAAVCAALRTRKARGRGELIELSLHESGVTLMGPWLIERQLGNQVVPLGNRHPRMVPHGVYRCRGEDAWLALACRDDDEWQHLARLIAHRGTTWTLRERLAAADTIDSAIGAWTRTRDKDRAAVELQAAGVPAGPVNTTPDMTADPQVQARGFFVRLDRGVPMPGNPVHMPGTQSSDWWPCPRLGADNEAVLRDWLGDDGRRAATLAGAGVLAKAPPD